MFLGRIQIRELWKLVSQIWTLLTLDDVIISCRSSTLARSFQRSEIQNYGFLTYKILQKQEVITYI